MAKSKSKKSPSKTKKKPALKPVKYLDVCSKLVTVLQKYDLALEDILKIYGHLGYVLGHALSNYGDKIPTADELMADYLQDPSAGKALMVQGIQIKSWVDIIKEKALEEKNEKEIVKEDNNETNQV